MNLQSSVLQKQQQVSGAKLPETPGCRSELVRNSSQFYLGHELVPNSGLPSCHPEGLGAPASDSQDLTGAEALGLHIQLQADLNLSLSEIQIAEFHSHSAACGLKANYTWMAKWLDVSSNHCVLTSSKHSAFVLWSR